MVPFEVQGLGPCQSTLQVTRPYGGRTAAIPVHSVSQLMPEFRLSRHDRVYTSLEDSSSLLASLQSVSALPSFRRQRTRARSKYCRFNHTADNHFSCAPPVRSCVYSSETPALTLAHDLQHEPCTRRIPGRRLHTSERNALSVLTTQVAYQTHGSGFRSSAGSWTLFSDANIQCHDPG